MNLTALHVKREQLAVARIRIDGQIEMLDELLKQASEETPAMAVAVRPVQEAKPSPKAQSGVKSHQFAPRNLTFQEIAQHLVDGPKSKKELSRLVKADPATVKRCLEKHNLLFHLVDPNSRYSLWELTDEGRKELAG